MAYNGPAYVNMCSYSDPESVLSQFESNKRLYGATDADVVLSEMAPAWPMPRGPKCRYRIAFMSYRGWRVYMLGTGCIASDPGHERDHPEDIAEMVASSYAD